MSHLNERAALVTGGGSGIGLACARRFAGRGMIVTLMGRNEARLGRGRQALIDDGVDPHRVRLAVGDVARERDLVAACATASADGAELAVVLANAGTGGLAPITACSAEAWDQVLSTNLRGVFLTFREGARAMRAHGRGGALCGISSIAGLRTHRWMSSYCVSKAGLDALVRNAADELGRDRIRVNSVAPGLVDTEIAAGLFSENTILQDYLDCMPIRRTGTVDDIANAVDFLCDEAASWITGVTLPVDGGHHLRRGPDLDPLARALFPEEAGADP